VTNYLNGNICTYVYVYLFIERERGGIIVMDIGADDAMPNSINIHFNTTLCVFRSVRPKVICVDI
jgi:hypothetical protein